MDRQRLPDASWIWFHPTCHSESYSSYHIASSAHHSLGDGRVTDELTTSLRPLRWFPWRVYLASAENFSRRVPAWSFRPSVSSWASTWVPLGRLWPSNLMKAARCSTPCALRWHPLPAPLLKIGINLCDDVEGKIPYNYYLGTPDGFDAQLQVLIFTAAPYASITTWEIMPKCYGSVQMYT